MISNVVNPTNTMQNAGTTSSSNTIPRSAVNVKPAQLNPINATEKDAQLNKVYAQDALKYGETTHRREYAFSFPLWGTAAQFLLDHPLLEHSHHERVEWTLSLLLSRATIHCWSVQCVSCVVHTDNSITPLIRL